jgi:hypothetical protein
VPGTMQGTNYFNADWKTGEGGSWEHWAIVNGELTVAEGTAVQDCTMGIEGIEAASAAAIPNPFNEHITVGTDQAAIFIYDFTGKIIFEDGHYNGYRINTSGFARGIYFIHMTVDGKRTAHKIIKE